MGTCRQTSFVDISFRSCSKMQLLPQPKKNSPLLSQKELINQNENFRSGDHTVADYLILALSFQPDPPARTGLTSLPSEIILLIIKHTKPMGVTCLSLTSKFFALHCLASKATFPSKQGRYLEDTRRVTFLNLLKSWVPKEYRMCYICRVFRPINSGHLKDIFEENLGYRWNPLERRNEVHNARKVLGLTLWKDEDWTFMSIGRRVSTRGKPETRMYCPACVREVDIIRIGRRSRKMWDALGKAKPA
jgi:hypothetical protein